MSCPYCEDGVCVSLVSHGIGPTRVYELVRETCWDCQGSGVGPEPAVFHGLDQASLDSILKGDKVSTTRAETITVTTGTTVQIVGIHGPDWFPLYIHSGLHQTTLYLHRAQLHALRLRLDELDDTVSV